MQPPANLSLPNFSPFASIGDRLAKIENFKPVDLTWISHRAADLQLRYESSFVDQIPRGTVHGDAWQGNIVVADSETVVLDLEAFGIGPQYWDLIALAVDRTDFQRISEPEYRLFCAAYGLDVTESPAYRTLADVQELRWTVYILEKASDGEDQAKEAAHRIACLRGLVPRPWKWGAY